jgi:hypothetical protein
MTPPRLWTTTTKQPIKYRLMRCEDLIRFYEHPRWARSPIPSVADSVTTSKASLLPSERGAAGLYGRQRVDEWVSVRVKRNAEYGDSSGLSELPDVLIIHS